MVKEAEIVTQLRDAEARLEKVEGEIDFYATESAALKVEVARLNEIIANLGGVGGEVSQDLVDVVASIGARATRMDEKQVDPPTE